MLVDAPEPQDDFDLGDGADEHKGDDWAGIPDPLMDAADDLPTDDGQERPDDADDNVDSQEKSGELDIF